MKALMQIGIMGSLVLILLASSLLSLGTGPRGEGYIGLLLRLEREERRGVKLTDEIEAGHELQQLHKQVADRLIHQEITLPAAAAQYRPVLQRMPCYMHALRRFNGGKSDDECMCRLAIRSVERALDGRPEQATILTRLEAELEEYLQGSQQSPPSSPPARLESCGAMSFTE